jgi:glycine dehydrogenase subunit 1
LTAAPGAELVFSGAPRFHEFVLNTLEAPALWNQRLMDEKIVGGLDLSRWYPELKNATLWCVTEIITREQIDRAAKVLATGLVEA